MLGRRCNDDEPLNRVFDAIMTSISRAAGKTNHNPVPHNLPGCPQPITRTRAGGTIPRCGEATREQLSAGVG